LYKQLIWIELNLHTGFEDPDLCGKERIPGCYERWHNIKRGTKGWRYRMSFVYSTHNNSLSWVSSMFQRIKLWMKPSPPAEHVFWLKNTSR
jgi:hypothetical protein